METQQVEYALPYQTLAFAADVPVLVLSEAATMLPVRAAVRVQPMHTCMHAKMACLSQTDCTVRLLPRGPVGATGHPPLAPDWFFPAARALVGLARCADYTIPPDMSEVCLCGGGGRMCVRAWVCLSVCLRVCVPGRCVDAD
jgi:hypothetical protein